MHRRAALVSLLAAASGAVAGCRGSDPATPAPPAPAPSSGGGVVPEPSRERLAYGPDPAQVGDLHRPTGASRGVVVVVHGGFWREAYDRSLGTPLAVDLAARGWTAWNLEYRRVGGGGGVPETLDDVAAGIDRLADVPDLDLTTVVTLGHSAGGHLATWAAARDTSAVSSWAPARVPVTHVVAQAAVLDLRAAGALGLGQAAADDFLGYPAVGAGPEVDPVQQVPLSQPVWCVHGELDATVPLAQSAAYVAAATRAGGTARLVEVPGDHRALIDPRSEAWARTVELLEGVAPARS